MKRRVYVETSVVSYLAARPSRDLLVAARQQITASWWETRRPTFRLFVSAVVLNEAGAGDAEAARRRMAFLVGIVVLDPTESARELAGRLLSDGALPPQAVDDAAHVAVAAVHGMDYLLTWNCRHIANAEKKPLIRTICQRSGFACPEICTPEELMGESDDGR
jgi:predicted nucleic acid-binding protein